MNNIPITALHSNSSWGVRVVIFLLNDENNGVPSLPILPPHHPILKHNMEKFSTYLVISYKSTFAFLI